MRPLILGISCWLAIASLFADDPPRPERSTSFQIQRKDFLDQLRLNALRSHAHPIQDTFTELLTAPSSPSPLIHLEDNQDNSMMGTLISSDPPMVVIAQKLLPQAAKQWTAHIKDHAYPIVDCELLSSSANLSLLTLDEQSAPAISPPLRFGSLPQVGTFIATQTLDRTVTWGTVSTPPHSKTAANYPSPEVFRHWKRIGLQTSDQISDYDFVFETDLMLSPEQCGGPVINLKGELCGVTVARSDHHATLVIPIQKILEILNKPDNERS